MKFYDLTHPATGQRHRLALRVFTMPGFPEVRTRVLVPLRQSPATDGWYPYVTEATPTIPATSGLEPGRSPSVGQVRRTLIAAGWGACVD